MGLTSTCVFIDLSRTFDSIDHEIFLKKLRLYGFNDKSVSFVTSYLESKSQSTIVNGYKSFDARLQCGTAQGSILGPLFFSLYVNDIFAMVENNNSLTIHADDTLLIEQGVTKESSIEACQNRLHEGETWREKNKLCINTEKTKAYIPPERKIPCVGGWRWAMPPTPDFCVGDTNMLVSKM